MKQNIFADSPTEEAVERSARREAPQLTIHETDCTVRQEGELPENLML